VIFVLKIKENLIKAGLSRTNLLFEELHKSEKQLNFIWVNHCLRDPAN